MPGFDSVCQHPGLTLLEVQSFNSLQVPACEGLEGGAGEGRWDLSFPLAQRVLLPQSMELAHEIRTSLV